MNKNKAAQTLGRLGGAARFKRYGIDGMSQAGTKGGNAILAAKGKKYYKELNQKSQAVKRLKKAGLST